MYPRCLLATVLAAVFAAVACADALGAADLYVAPGGRSGATGSRQDPLPAVNDALSRARGGETIEVAAGRYGRLRDTVGSRAGVVTVRGAAGGERPDIAGADVMGGRGLRLEDLAFSDAVTVSKHPTGGPPAAARDVTFLRSDFTTDYRSSCVTIGAGVRDISIVDSRIHDCYIGVGGPGGWAQSSGITVQRTLLEDFSMDAIAFGNWSHVVLDGNEIRHMEDPDGYRHTDGIQFYGNSESVRISGNVVHGSTDGQGIFIQPQLGPIEDVLVENNLVYDINGIAIQQQGARGVRFVNNTVWKTTYGALLLRGGLQGPATDTVVVNNVLETYTEYEGARAAVRSDNLIGKTVLTGAAPVLGADPLFRNAPDGDYTLGDGSPARDRAAGEYAPAEDMLGHPRVGLPDIGALEAGGEGTPPTVVFRSGPGESTSPDALFVFASAPVGTATECSVDGGAWYACASPLRLTGLSCGDHALSIRPVRPGWLIGEPATRTWTVGSPATPGDDSPVAEPTDSGTPDGDGSALPASGSAAPDPRCGGEPSTGCETSDGATHGGGRRTGGGRVRRAAVDRRGRFSIRRLRLPPSAGAVIQVAATTTVRDRRGRRRTVCVARARQHPHGARAGSRGAVGMRLSRWARARLRRRGHLKVVISATATGGSGAATSRRVRVRLTLARRLRR